MPEPVLQTAEPSPALSAFLRGVERRGAVFALLQSGNAQAADRALLAAMRAFCAAAASNLVVADWPRRFWSLLLAAPELRHVPDETSWTDDLLPLAELGRGPRAALLLRLVAGLSEIDAAGVLGIAKPTYRIALQRALPHGEDGRPDAEAWRALGAAAQMAIRDIAVDRLAHLARMRDAALHAQRLEPIVALPLVPAERQPALAARRRWRLPAIAAVATVCVIALAATFLLPLVTPVEAPGSRRVRAEPLPAAEPPAATFDSDVALLTHPDFDQVLAQQADSPSRDPGFYAWLAAGSPATRIERETDLHSAAGGAPPPAAAPTAAARPSAAAEDDAALESSDAP